MIARIYKTTPSPTQSGPGADKWVIEFTHDRMSIDSTMGWASSSDTMHEVKLSFDSAEDAINFANKNNYKFEVISSSLPKIIKKSYADNFM